MSISYGMEKRFEYESNNATKPSCYKMLKKNNKTGCAGLISMKSCSMLAVAVIIAGMAGPSQAMPNVKHRFLIHKRSEEPQSTLIAFPRVGRSVSDNDFNMLDDQNTETRSHTRSKRQALIPFPRTGKRAALIPFPRTGKKRAALVAYPRTGKRASLVPFARIGKRTYDSSMPVRYRNGNPWAMLRDESGQLRPLISIVSGKRNEFPTNSQIAHESDIPSTMNDYIDNDDHRVTRFARSEDAKNGINTEQDATGLTKNLGLFDLDPEEIDLFRGFNME